MTTTRLPRAAMKPNALLPITSLITILLMSIHITDDIVRGISPARPDNIGAVVIFVVWLLGTLMLAQRRLGQIIMLLGGIFAAAMPVLHMRGASYPAIAKGDGGFLFVWILILVGSAGVVAFILSIQALWLGRSGNAR